MTAFFIIAITCLGCQTNLEAKRTIFSVEFATLEDCQMLEAKWIEDPDTRVLTYCDTGAEQETTDPIVPSCDFT